MLQALCLLFLITTPCTITILFWSESTFKNKEIDRNERNEFHIFQNLNHQEYSLYNINKTCPFVIHPIKESLK